MNTGLGEAREDERGSSSDINSCILYPTSAQGHPGWPEANFQSRKLILQNSNFLSLELRSLSAHPTPHHCYHSFLKVQMLTTLPYSLLHQDNTATFATSVQSGSQERLPCLPFTLRCRVYQCGFCFRKYLAFSGSPLLFSLAFPKPSNGSSSHWVISQPQDTLFNQNRF